MHLPQLIQLRLLPVFRGYSLTRCEVENLLPWFLYRCRSRIGGNYTCCRICGIPQSFFIGFIAAFVLILRSTGKVKLLLTTHLDVFPCHGIGGIVGMILTGVFASKKINPAGNDGLIYGGTEFFLHQLLGCVIVVVFATVMGFILFKL